MKLFEKEEWKKVFEDWFDELKHHPIKNFCLFMMWVVITFLIFYVFGSVNYGAQYCIIQEHQMEYRASPFETKADRQMNDYLLEQVKNEWNFNEIPQGESYSFYVDYFNSKGGLPPYFSLNCSWDLKRYFGGAIEKWVQ